MKKLIRALAFFALTAALFCAVSEVLRDKAYASSSAVIYHRPKNTVNVVFAGSSHMLNGVDAELFSELYETEAANIAQNAQTLPVTYYMLKEAFRLQDPHTVVLDVSKAVVDVPYESAESLHFSLDGMPFGVTKCQAVFDLTEKGDRGEYLFPIIRYHSRWKTLTESDFEPVTYTRGGVALNGVYDNTVWQVPAPDKKAPVPAVPLKYLEKIARLCEKEGAKLILVALPMRDGYEDGLPRVETVNAVADFAAEKDLPFINYIYDTAVVDYKSDFADCGHLNGEGQKKMTKRLGEVIFPAGEK